MTERNLSDVVGSEAGDNILSIKPVYKCVLIVTNIGQPRCVLVQLCICERDMSETCTWW